MWRLLTRPAIGISFALPTRADDRAAARRRPGVSGRGFVYVWRTLRLLVDHSDLSADALQPVLQSGSVTVQSYRKLRWGGRTGLLLDAA